MIGKPSEEVRLAEYASLRQETSQRAAIQQALVALNLTVAGTVTGLVVSRTCLQELFVIVAITSSTFGLLWLDHHLSIHQIADYVKDELWLWEPSWEGYNRAHGKPRWWQFVYVVVMMLVFVAVAVAALVISRGHVDGLLEILWLIGAGLTALTGFVFCALLMRGPARVK